MKVRFKRKKKRGINQKTRRLWFSVEGYRIIWRSSVTGVKVQPRFQACVRIIVPGRFENDRTEMWDFVNPNKQLYKTIKAAVADCEQHQQLWSQATECLGIRAIRELFGRKPTGIPKWTLSKIDRRVLAILLDTQPQYKEEYEEEEEETPTKRKQKTCSPRKPTATAKKKRKPRSDKGQKRGPRKGTKK